MNEFSDLFGSRGQWGVYELNLIESIYEIMWIDEPLRLKNLTWTRIVRAAYHFLEQGFFKDRDIVIEAYVRIADQIIPSLRRSHEKRRAITDNTELDVDAKIELYLQYYKIMYESLYPIVVGPVLVAFASAKGIGDKAFRQRDDGKVSLNVIQRLEKWIIYTQNILSIGLNSHVRNAYSHEHFRLLDEGKVELWDIHPSDPAKNWGPEIWTIERLREICDDIYLNSLAIVAALVLFSINYGGAIRRVANSANMPTTPLRKAELREVVHMMANKESFDIVEEKLEKPSIAMRLSTRRKGIDQEEEILVGGPVVQRFKRPVRYVQVEIIQQVLGFLQLIGPYLSEWEEVDIQIRDYEEQELGKIHVDVATINNIPGKDQATVEEARQLLSYDSLANIKMWVRLGGAPIEY
jgi:hypothetical protein